MPIITLLTDFGTKDSYVAEMKGVILQICPEAILVDISHDIGKYDIEEGAYNLARSVGYFPRGTIHVGVVDPGVGGARKPLVFQAEGAVLVGPDNGLLAPAAERLGIIKIYEINRFDLLPKKVSDVFHGRDIFSPTAALIARGRQPAELGTGVSEYQRMPLFDLSVNDGTILCRVITVDAFGNLVTNTTYRELEQAGIQLGASVQAVIEGRTHLVPLVRNFSSVPKGELLMLVAGGGYLEFSVNQGDAATRLGVGKGTQVLLSRA